MQVSRDTLGSQKCFHLHIIQVVIDLPNISTPNGADIDGESVAQCHFPVIIARIGAVRAGIVARCSFVTICAGVRFQWVRSDDNSTFWVTGILHYVSLQCSKQFQKPRRLRATSIRHLGVLQMLQLDLKDFDRGQVDRTHSF